jgi:hypothetical protein
VMFSRGQRLGTRTSRDRRVVRVPGLDERADVNRAARKRNGRGGHPAAADTTIAARDDADLTARLPVVVALRYPPSGRRTLPLDIVPDCCHCVEGGHVHRGGKGKVRRAGCGRGKYVIWPRVVLSRRARVETAA